MRDHRRGKLDGKGIKERGRPRRGPGNMGVKHEWGLELKKGGKPDGRSEKGERKAQRARVSTWGSFKRKE